MNTAKGVAMLIFPYLLPWLLVRIRPEIFPGSVNLDFFQVSNLKISIVDENIDFKEKPHHSKVFMSPVSLWLIFGFFQCINWIFPNSLHRVWFKFCKFPKIKVPSIKALQLFKLPRTEQYSKHHQLLLVHWTISYYRRLQTKSNLQTLTRGRATFWKL